MHERFTMTTTPESSYHVRGMTCEHCRMAVSREVLQVEGVEGVDVDLYAGRIIVSGGSVDHQAVRAAVDEAGYQVIA
jgi:copper chaperone CopZ